MRSLKLHVQLPVPCCQTVMAPAHLLQLSSLCPYQQLSEQSFPPVLVTCSTNDARVPFWGPLKWASKARQMQKGCAPIVLFNHEDGGHFGHDTDALHTAAVEQAFLLSALSRAGKQSRL